MHLDLVCHHVPSTRYHVGARFFAEGSGPFSPVKESEKQLKYRLGSQGRCPLRRVTFTLRPKRTPDGPDLHCPLFLFFAMVKSQKRGTCGPRDDRTRTGCSSPAPRRCGSCGPGPGAHRDKLPGPSAQWMQCRKPGAFHVFLHALKYHVSYLRKYVSSNQHEN